MKALNIKRIADCYHLTIGIFLSYTQTQNSLRPLFSRPRMIGRFKFVWVKMHSRIFLFRYILKYLFLSESFPFNNSKICTWCMFNIKYRIFSLRVISWVCCVRYVCVIFYCMRLVWMCACIVASLHLPHVCQKINHLPKSKIYLVTTTPPKRLDGLSWNFRRFILYLSTEKLKILLLIIF